MMGPLFIIGYMGVGKSTVGQLLAKELGRSFVDLDERIEEASGIGIPRFFQVHGETAFRRKEAELLERVAREGDAVIACGGGAPCHGSNLELMQEHGVLVYLKAEPKLLSERLKGKGTGRPKLGESDANSIEAHLREREAYYRKADLIVPAEEESPERTVERVLEKLDHSR